MEKINKTYLATHYSSEKIKNTLLDFIFLHGSNIQYREALENQSFDGLYGIYEDVFNALSKRDSNDTI